MGRYSNRHRANIANRELRRGISASAFMAGFSATSASREPRPVFMPCASCKREVSTLVEGECFVCHSPAEGKPLKDMTAKQCAEVHTCGVLNWRHIDGWDGNWLSCDEAKRRNGQ